MSRISKNQQGSIEIHSTTTDPRLPPKSHRANAAKLEALAKQLGIYPTEEKLRSARWVMRIGQMLRRARIEGEVSQATLAETSGIKQPYLSRLETGLTLSGNEVRGPSCAVLLRCADALGCDMRIELVSRKTGKVMAAGNSAELETA